uniref:Protein MIX23 n=1 Tax=Caligus rogercresseyi TaxID=217165 RepID=C1BQ14_CALRO|nr:Coiled-coil domain-containing protein 58 [Caligus rogercresseyi]
MADPILICEDVTHFGKTLKEMRTLDDKIIYVLNNSLPTVSFTRDKAELTSQCINLSEQVNKTFDSRRRLISNCVEITQKKLDEASESDVKRGLRLKMHLIKNEISVEDVIQHRTKTVLHERCRDYVNVSL